MGGSDRAVSDLTLDARVKDLDAVVAQLGVDRFALDLITIRRIHRSTLWAAPLAFATVALSVPLGMTNAWHAFAALLKRTIGPYI